MMQTLPRQGLKAAFAVSGLCLILIGCGDGSLQTYPAGGTIVYEDGKPVTNVSVALHPLDGGIHTPAGALDSAGKFRLSTYKDGDGAPAGKYKVYFRAAAAEVDTAPPPADPAFLPQRPQGMLAPEFVVASDLLAAATTTLSLEIKPDGNNTGIRLKVQRPQRTTPQFRTPR